ncbi:MAG: hypothetical protein OIN87_05115 [Candidatus Methanoperedens sp.]|nr:hypothetical protein [Candidatus Methanoperedens sp.]
MSEDSSFNKKKPQMNADERRCGVDLCGSSGKGTLVNEKIEVLENSSGLTPLGFGGNSRKVKMNIDSVDVGSSTTECAEHTELLNDSSGLSPLRLSVETYNINKKNLMIGDFSVSLGKGIMEKEKIETMRHSTGLTPLNFDSEVPIKASGVTPPKGIRVRGANYVAREID